MNCQFKILLANSRNFFLPGLIWFEIKMLWTDGLLEYVKDLWNIVDYITNMFYVAWIFLRVTSWILVHRDLWFYDKWPWYPREKWHSFDPMLISEGCFGAAMIFRQVNNFLVFRRSFCYLGKLKTFEFCMKFFVILVS